VKSTYRFGGNYEAEVRAVTCLRARRGRMQGQPRSAEHPMCAKGAEGYASRPQSATTGAIHHSHAHQPSLGLLSVVVEPASC